MTASPGNDSSEALVTQTPTPDGTAALTEESVAAWLGRHPRFFHQHQNLLLELSIPHESGNAISLLERQVSLFRERQHGLQDQIHEFISNARENDNLFEKTRLVLLELLRCTTLQTLLRCIDQRLAVDFDASASALVFVSDKAAPPEPGVRVLPAGQTAEVLGDLARQRTYCGALNGAQQQLLFPACIPPIVSAAIVPLHVPEDSRIRSGFGLPLLLIGSSGEQHFNSSLDTLFLDFIGEVLAVHLQNLMSTS